MTNWNWQVAMAEENSDVQMMTIVPETEEDTTVYMTPPVERDTHSHYFKDVSNLTEVDVYRVCRLFKVTDQAIGHAIKKLLLPGGRGVKLGSQDVQEAIDSLVRYVEMEAEDETSP